MPSSIEAPSLEQRIATLRELVPLLPLQEPRPLFTEAGRGKLVAPWIQYHLSGGGSDASDRIAQLLGTAPEVVFAQLDEFYSAGMGTSLNTRKTLEGLSLERIFDFEQFRAHADSDAPPTAVWWGLCLPVLNPALDRACIDAILGGRCGAEDFRWLARKTRGAWTLEAILPPR